MISGKRLRQFGMKKSIFVFAIWLPPAMYAAIQSVSTVENTFAVPEDSSPPYSHILDEYHLDLDHIESQSITEPNNLIATTLQPSNNEHTGIVVVATLDGTFYGLDTTNGKTIWKQSGWPPSADQHDFNSFHATTMVDSQRFFMPMVSTTSTTRSYSTKHRSASSSQFDTSTLAIPSIDGRVFLTPFTKNEEEYYHKLWRKLRPPSNDSRSSSQGQSTVHSDSKKTGKRKSILWTPHKDWTISTTTRDIVDQSPFFDAQGHLYLGSCSSMTAALDRDTGDLVHIFPKSKPTQEHDSNKHGQALKHDDSLGHRCSDTNETNEDDFTVTPKPRNLVWIGREDYSVSMFHPPSLQEDVRFSTSHLHSINDMMYDQYQLNSESNPYTGEETIENRLQIIPESRHTGLSFKPLYQSMDASLEEGEFRYGTASYVASSNKRVPLAPIGQKSVVSTPDGQLMMQNPETGQVLWMTDEIFTSPVVFAMDSYTGRSLHLDFLQDISTDDHQEDTALVGALSSGQLFAIPLQPHQQITRRLPRLISTKAANAASSDLTLWSPDKTPVRKIDWTHPTYNQLNTDESVKAISSVSHRCNPSLANFPQCLFNPLQADKNSIRLDSDNHLNVDLMNFLAAGYLPPDYWQEKRKMDEDRRTKSSRFSFIVKFLLSWVPPAVALSFVISFEVGRRERERKRKREESSNVPKDLNVLGQRLESIERETEDTMPRLEEETHIVRDESSARLIQVSEIVLGYGGHGTVVFKGSLAGRNVAVKRMLKNYHASADREISLLIESDGHPNVVRYFFKEVRGDFVYLALEMCDASLQDLISSVTRQISRRNYDSQVLANVTKKVLYHIVLGVKHLHNLRIVHRDLKPQNILLAHKSRSDNSFHMESDDAFDKLFQGFTNDEYLPKISDMGLGKQLTAQSSYGVSTKGGELNEASTIGGAGPGSVGWQAPEVMARRSMDLPIRNTDQFNESKDGSPSLDGSLNTRTSRSVDIFSLGCIFYSTLVPGSHPFGEWYEREANIMRYQPEISRLEDVSYEAFDLVSQMIQRDSKSRPTASQVCEAPFFWDSVKKSSFLCDFSDRLEAESLLVPNNSFDILVVERNAQKVVGDAWNIRVDGDLLLHLSKYRSYDPSSVRDCLRMIRNKHHHFDEIPFELRQRMFHGSENLQGYFESKFPRLLQHCYNICRFFLSVDDPLNLKYHIPSSLSTCAEKVVESETKDDIKEGITDAALSNLFPQSITQTLESKNQISLNELVLWEGSNAARAFNCRGWMRSQEVWTLGSDLQTKKRDANMTKCLEDPKFRTRLCNHWDVSLGVSCPMRKKYKCVFAHGPVELRVKEGKKDRWGKLVDKNGNNANPCHSGGEDTYGAAKMIENTRQGQGKVKL